MPELKLTLNETPTPQQRARITRWGSYDPSKEGKNWIKTQIKMQLEGTDFKLIETAIELIVIFYMPIPKSISKKKREAMLKGEIKHTKAPDGDNLYKKSTDAMNQLIYKDDKQIWRHEVEKVYDENPRTEILVIW